MSQSPVRRTATPSLEAIISDIDENGIGKKGTKVIDKINSLAEGSVHYTFEVFPPKTDIGMLNLVDRMERMALLNPSWLHVTWGAGGSTHQRSLELAATFQKTMGFDTCLHITCTNMDRRILDTTLDFALKVGIVNLLALRGDPPRDGEFWSAGDSGFQHATDLVRYIRDRHGNAFCIGVAGYPEGHMDSDDKSVDIDRLIEKQAAGADFVVTQLFYDTTLYLSWVEECRSRGLTLPIIPGIMPIQNYASFRRMTNLCHCAVPPQIIADLEAIQSDDAAVKAYGVQLAATMISDLRAGGVTCFHLCTLNLEKSVTRLLDALGWLGNDSSADSGNSTPIMKNASADERSLIKSVKTKHKDSPTTWDEFPNGRFGDARSPAYGELDGYGPSLKLPRATALKLWGRPATDDDVTRIFAGYLAETLPAIPWCDEALRAETATIVPRLQQLNARGWWTVGSQPSVDGAPSADPVFGFGPPGGYVYQKAFVEFFVDAKELDALVARIDGAKHGIFSYYASNRAGETRTNAKKGDVNAVTWAVFQGSEIVTTTLIEEMSFKAWKDEAFDIWMEWAHIYPGSSPSYKYIKNVAETRWLVSIVYHDYKNFSGLWDFLLEQ